MTHPREKAGPTHPDQSILDFVIVNGCVVAHGQDMLAGVPLADANQKATVSEARVFQQLDSFLKNKIGNPGNMNSAFCQLRRPLIMSKSKTTDYEGSKSKKTF